MNNPLSRSRKIYWGIDPTSDCLSLGHIKCALRLNWLYLDYPDMELTLLIGDYTVRYGDPSDKKEARVISGGYERNASKLAELLGRIFAGKSHRIVYNSSWLERLSLTDFIALYGEVSLNATLKYSYVKRRIDSNSHLPLREYLYNFLQGYDFYHLNKAYGCQIQFGGADQYINMLQGVKLCKREGLRAYALTSPLLIDRGKKVSKTTHPNLKIGADTSPFEFRLQLEALSDELLADVANVSVRDIKRRNSGVIVRGKRNRIILFIIKSVFPIDYMGAYVIASKEREAKALYRIVFPNHSNRWAKERAAIESRSKYALLTVKRVRLLIRYV